MCLRVGNSTDFELFHTIHANHWSRWHVGVSKSRISLFKEFETSDIDASMCLTKRVRQVQRDLGPASRRDHKRTKLPGSQFIGNVYGCVLGVQPYFVPNLDGGGY